MGTVSPSTGPIVHCCRHMSDSPWALMGDHGLERYGLGVGWAVREKPSLGWAGPVNREHPMGWKISAQPGPSGALFGTKHRFEWLDENQQKWQRMTENQRNKHNVWANSVSHCVEQTSSKWKLITRILPSLVRVLPAAHRRSVEHTNSNSFS